MICVGDCMFVHIEDNAIYLGCYVDKDDRALPSDYISRLDMTIERCLTHCRTIGHMYAGLQNGSGCWCGDNYNKYGEADEAYCNKTCSGNDEQLCGGEYRNSVVKLSKYISSVWSTNLSSAYFPF